MRAGTSTQPIRVAGLVSSSSKRGTQATSSSGIVQAVKFLIVVGAIGLAACASEPGPELTAAMPASAAHDATVTLSGERLCGTSNDCMAVTSTIQIGLTFPTIDALITAYSASSATIAIPDLAQVGSTQLIVTVDNRASNALDFEVLP